MDDVEKLSAAEVHLLAIWKTLIQERQVTFARYVEGILAEILDITMNPSARVAVAAELWRAFNAHPKAFPDFGIWWDDNAERLQENLEFAQHKDALHSLLA